MATAVALTTIAATLRTSSALGSLLSPFPWPGCWEVRCSALHDSTQRRLWTNCTSVHRGALQLATSGIHYAHPDSASGCGEERGIFSAEHASLAGVPASQPPASLLPASRITLIGRSLKALCRRPRLPSTSTPAHSDHVRRLAPVLLARVLYSPTFLPAIPATLYRLLPLGRTAREPSRCWRDIVMLAIVGSTYATVHMRKSCARHPCPPAL
jgi:hypothetical protein